MLMRDTEKCYLPPDRKLTKEITSSKPRIVKQCVYWLFAGAGENRTQLHQCSVPCEP